MFPYSETNPEKPISTGLIQSNLKVIVTRSGLSATNYAFHSCKLGATTLASKKGIDMSKIRQMGRWRSTAMVDRYTRAQPDTLAQLSTDMCA